MVYLGCHLSSSKGFLHMGKTALELGADTFQFFTRNLRGSKSKALDEEDCRQLCELMQAHGFGPIVAHAPYTINPCSKDERIRRFALSTLKDDLKRLEHLPGSYYNLHPGSHVGQGETAAIAMIAAALNAAMFPGQKTTVLLETMAGKGSEVGSTFEQLRKIIDGVELTGAIGVCLDTCHVHDGGYDIAGDLDGVLTQFDQIIGLDRLKALHINDSKNPLASHKDRHARLAEGEIGLDAIVRIVNHPALQGLPMILETPNEPDGYAREIAVLKKTLRDIP